MFSLERTFQLKYVSAFLRGDCHNTFCPGFFVQCVLSAVCCLQCSRCIIVYVRVMHQLLNLVFALPGIHARHSCPASVPASLARQPYPPDLPATLARQPCPPA
jgi:hypothetical protein